MLVGVLMIGIAALLWQPESEGAMLAALRLKPPLAHSGDVGPRVRRGKRLLIWHFHLRKHLRIHAIVWANHLVLRQEVRGECVDLVIGERPWSIEGHRSMDVVPDGRGIWPVVADGRLVHTDAILRRVYKSRPGGGAFAVRAVTGGAFRRENRLSIAGGATSGREPLSVRTNVDVYASHFVV